MTRLSELQSAFERYVVVGDNEEHLAVSVAAAKGVPAETRLDVYRNAYYWRLQEALAHDFPALLAVAGDEAFGRLVTAYLHARPPTRPSLRWLGQHLSDWLRADGHPQELIDLSLLEWAVLHAFDAEDRAVAAPAQLAALPQDQWPRLRVELHPSVSQLSVRTNARDRWFAVRSGKPPPALQHISERLIVSRTRRGPSVDCVSQPFHALLGSLSRGATLATSCAGLADLCNPDDVPQIAATCLYEALSRGWIASVHVT